MKLSILTPAVPSRIDSLQRLCEKIGGQIGALPVEHLVLMDNRRRTVGEKRDALLRAALGHYVAFVDDDDDIAPNYVAEILKAVESAPDVVTFQQYAIIEDQGGIVDFQLGHPNEPFTPGGTTRRNAWHVCAWRRHLAMLSSFPASNYGEDWAFASRLCAIPGLTSVHIPAILHFYSHSAAATLAPAPLTPAPGGHGK